MGRSSCKGSAARVQAQVLSSYTPGGHSACSQLQAPKCVACLDTVVGEHAVRGGGQLHARPPGGGDQGRHVARQAHAAGARCAQRVGVQPGAASLTHALRACGAQDDSQGLGIWLVGGNAELVQLPGCALCCWRPGLWCPGRCHASSMPEATVSSLILWLRCRCAFKSCFDTEYWSIR